MALGEKDTSLVRLLADSADRNASVPVYTFISGGEGEDNASTMTLATLYRRSQAIAAILQQTEHRGNRVLLLCYPGLETFAAFWGAVLAGLIPVPVPTSRKREDDRRFDGIVADCEPSIILGGTTKQWTKFAGQSGGSLKHLDTGSIGDEESRAWKAPHISSKDPAFLQYTSGSTATPKGVIVSHANLLSNAQRMHETFNLTPDSCSVIWLPLYHDMGLIGGMLQPVFSGYRSIFMSPAAFIDRPLRWLESISTYRATISGGPNFAYELCIRQIESSTHLDIDLDCWQVAFNGSEPVRHETLRRFEAAFAKYGFRSSAFRPCYGLAEATLLVSAHRYSGQSLPCLPIIAGRNEIQPPAEQAHVSQFVSLGAPVSGHQIEIVNPKTRRRVGAGEIGEIWISGPNVAQGYWANGEETERTFRAYLHDEKTGPFLRTGDLGTLRDRELYVVGRLKGVIIIRGRNYYAEDIEATVEKCDPALGVRSAAFSVEVENEESLVLVHELKRGQRRLDVERVCAQIRTTIAKEFQLRTQAIVLLPYGRLPKTSSGKVRRDSCRALFTAGKLQAIHISLMQDSSSDNSVPQQWSEKEREIDGTVSKAIADLLNVEERDIPVESSIASLGLDSMMAMKLKSFIQKQKAVDVPFVTLMNLSVKEIANLVADEENRQPHLEDGSQPACPQQQRAVHSEEREFPLSEGQKALWFLHQLNPQDSGLTIARAIRIGNRIDIAALERSFRALADRHPMLRATFNDHGSELKQSCNGNILFQAVDATNWDRPTLEARILEEAKRPFDLKCGPIFRTHLFITLECDSVLLFSAHHLALDLWSLSLLLRELGILYNCHRHNAPVPLPLPSYRYSDYVEWQSRFLSDERSERQWQYWKRQLEDAPPMLQLPFVSSAQEGHRDPGNWRFKIDQETTQKLRQASRESGSTLSALLMASFSVLLARYSGQEEFVLGTLASERTQAEFAGVVGYFVNPIVLPVHFNAQLPFNEFLRQFETQLASALDNQSFPFGTLVKRLHPTRISAGRSPLLQVICICHPAGLIEEQNLSGFIMGNEGSTLPVADLIFESMDMPPAGTEFDLALVFAEGKDGLEAAFQYDCGQFKSEAVRQMAENFRELLTAVAKNPALPNGVLPVVAHQDMEARQSWNDTALDYPSLCIHQIIERQAEKSPNAVALIHRSAQMTYAELNQRSNQIAWSLRERGVDCETRVGLLLERGPDMVIALLGILKAGAAYVPMDPANPPDRLNTVVQGAKSKFVLTTVRLSRLLSLPPTQLFCIDDPTNTLSSSCSVPANCAVSPQNLAYVIYTSGSTGRPKGVMVQHQSVINFFEGMDEKVGCSPSDTLLAVTNIGFDISILELLWTLSRGARVIIADDQAGRRPHRHPRSALHEIQFSLFYFASGESAARDNKYELLVEGAKFADANGFRSVWTPERHFHDFGGLFPNPSVTSALLAGITSQIQLRAGSVVLPLHDPIRVAEEWSLVDNLSNGRVGIAFASGWHADDFVFFPDNYAARKEVMYEGIKAIQRLWHGDPLCVKSGSGSEIEITLHPKPVQAELPIWITSAGSTATFQEAGQIKANLLTHLLGQETTDLGNKIAAYRRSLEHNGADPDRFTSTLMLHTYIDESRDRVRDKAFLPFKQYLRSSLGLVANLIRSLNLNLDVSKMNAKDLDDLLTFAAERYMGSSGLVGTSDSCLEVLESIAQIGITEVACLIDFGVEVPAVMASLERIRDLKDSLRSDRTIIEYSIGALAQRFEVTLMQCTPSLMLLALQDPRISKALQRLRVLMLGGEAVPAALVKQVAAAGTRTIMNMYGPTETTIWSAVHEVSPDLVPVTIGGPISNTQVHVLSRELVSLPLGVVGELFIGGEGLARGYLHDAALTSEKFLPDPLSVIPGRRLYRTGDLGRQLEDGSIELLGRTDQQVKIHGYRVELAEIETVLDEAPRVLRAVVLKQVVGEGQHQLVAYLVAEPQCSIDVELVREFARAKLPEYMVPPLICIVGTIPVSSNGKIDRNALSAKVVLPTSTAQVIAAPQNTLEATILSVWTEVLGIETVSIDDNFFDVGGHSLLIAQVHSLLQQKLAREFPLLAILERPTIRAMAHFLERNAQPSPSSSEQQSDRQKKALFEQRDRGRIARAQA